MKELLDRVQEQLNENWYVEPEDIQVLIDRVKECADFLDKNGKCQSCLDNQYYCNDWYCPSCKVNIPPEEVTFNETHDKRKGGCGNPVI